MKSSVLLFSLFLAISFLSVVNGGRELKETQVSTAHVNLTNMTKTAHMAKDGKPLLHPSEGHYEEGGDFEHEEHHHYECDDDCDDDDRGDRCDDCDEGEHHHDCDDCDEGEHHHDCDDCEEHEHDHDCDDCDEKLLHWDKHALKNQKMHKSKNRTVAKP